VTLVFYTRDKDTTPQAALKLWFDENFAKLSLAKYADRTSRGNDWIKVEWSSTKWYDGYEEVAEVNAAIKLFAATFRADDDDTKVAWESIRIGEEIADIEHDGSIYQNYRLGASREITFD
jgi:hypothetical protein